VYILIFTFWDTKICSTNTLMSTSPRTMAITTYCVYSPGCIIFSVRKYKCDGVRCSIWSRALLASVTQEGNVILTEPALGLRAMTPHRQQLTAYYNYWQGWPATAGVQLVTGSEVP
jgi:hypothetical protein